VPELIEGQPEWKVEEVLNSRRYRCKLQYLIKWKGYADAHNSWEPKENVTAPALLAAYHEQNTAAVRKLKMEQADCGQDKHPLDSKRQTDKHPLESKRQSKALDPDDCAQNGNRRINEETRTQPEVRPRKATGFVERLRAVFL